MIWARTRSVCLEASEAGVEAGDLFECSVASSAALPRCMCHVFEEGSVAPWQNLCRNMFGLRASPMHHRMSGYVSCGTGDPTARLASVSPCGERSRQQRTGHVAYPSMRARGRRWRLVCPSGLPSLGARPPWAQPQLSRAHVRGGAPATHTRGLWGIALSWSGPGISDAWLAGRPYRRGEQLGVSTRLATEQVSVEGPVKQILLTMPQHRPSRQR